MARVFAHQGAGMKIGDDDVGGCAKHFEAALRACPIHPFQEDTVGAIAKRSVTLMSLMVGRGTVVFINTSRTKVAMTHAHAGLR